MNAFWIQVCVWKETEGQLQHGGYSGSDECRDSAALDAAETRAARGFEGSHAYGRRANGGIMRVISLCGPVSVLGCLLVASSLASAAGVRSHVAKIVVF